MADRAGFRGEDVPRFPAPLRRRDERSPYRERLAPNTPSAEPPPPSGKPRLVVVRPDSPEQMRHAFLREPLPAPPAPPVGWLRRAFALPVLFFRQYPLLLWLFMLPVVTLPILSLWVQWYERSLGMATYTK
jgi:hypothetical protein